MPENKYIVYCHTNKKNNKKYIGITCQKAQRRWKSGWGYLSSPYFLNAIKKYGWDNFTHEVLFENLSKEDAENKEIELIAKYNLTNKKYGYNSRHGGNSNIPNEETLEKMRKAGQARADDIKRYYAEHPDALEAVRLRVLKDYQEHPEIKEKIRDSVKRAFINNPKLRELCCLHSKKPVMCIETGVIYSSVSETARAFNVTKESISCHLHGRCKTIKNMHFKFIDKNYKDAV